MSRPCFYGTNFRFVKENASIFGAVRKQRLGLRYSRWQFSDTGYGPRTAAKQPYTTKANGTDIQYLYLAIGA